VIYTAAAAPAACQNIVATYMAAVGALAAYQHAEATCTAAAAAPAACQNVVATYMAAAAAPAGTVAGV
jgi:hypothetical protein